MAGELEDWWRSMPFVTKYLFAGSLIVTVAANFNLVSWAYLTLDFTRIYQRFEIWRFVTAFLFHGRLGFPFLINLMFLVKYGASVEQTTFGNDTADYLFFILTSAFLLFLPAYLLNIPILGESLILAIVYYWSRKNPNIPMNFFMINFPSAYFPWVLIGFRLLMGGSPIAELLGVLVGHIFYFCNELYPLQAGRRIISTPQFLKDLFPSPGGQRGIPQGGGVGGQQQQQQQQQVHQGGGINWGQGRRLGD